MTTVSPDPAVEDIAPGARAFLKLMKDRSEADKVAVLDVLRERLPGSHYSPAQEVCADALCRCREETGRLSKRRYQTWREDLDDPGSVPTSARIIRVFGSWTDARVAVGEKVEADPASARLLMTTAFDSEYVLRALTVWADLRDGPLYQKDFATWCRTKEAERLMGGVMPTSVETINRWLGPWRLALLSAGLSTRRGRPGSSQPKPLPLAQTQSRHVPCQHIDPATVPQVGPTARAGDLATWAQWLRDLLGEQEFSALRLSDYKQLIVKLEAEGAALGIVVALPSVSTIKCSGYGWRRFKSHAGVPFDPDAIEPPDGSRGRPPIKKEACIAALRRAAADLGSVPTRRAYQLWRKRSCPSAPHDLTITRTLSTGKPSWTEALKVALGKP